MLWIGTAQVAYASETSHRLCIPGPVALPIFRAEKDALILVYSGILSRSYTGLVEANSRTVLHTMPCLLKAMSLDLQFIRTWCSIGRDGMQELSKCICMCILAVKPSQFGVLLGLGFPDEVPGFFILAHAPPRAKTCPQPHWIPCHGFRNSARPN